uniref:Uncharacterized protein n=1 Tax=Talaromyces marneffei PM1 TaxID=1077442 RepID=A0A093VBG8_TALMA
MPRSVQHWPGGIPTSIQPHSEADLSLDQIKQEVKGWLLFVQAYQSRAPLGLPGTEGPRFNEPSEGLRYPAEALERLYDTLQPIDLGSLISIAPVDEAHAANRARWVKFVILLYNHDIETGHCLLGNYMPSEAIFNPATTTDFSVENFLPWHDLETANFRGPYMLADEHGLKTGRLTLVEYEMNGTVKESLHIRPFNMQMPYLRAFEDGAGFDDISHAQGAYRYQNSPLDMDLPIIDILCQAKEANQLPTSMAICDREQWTSDVELYAPGYLALEAQGRGGEYPLTSLTAPIGGVKKEVLNRVHDPRFTFIAPGTFP